MDRGDDGNHDASISPAGAAFAEYLERRESGEQVDFEAFCAARPALSERLRRLREQFQRLGGSVVTAPGGESVFGRLERRFGGSVDPRVDLAPVEGRDASRRGEVLERFRGQDAPRRYAEQEEVGRGGMGSVLRVFDNDIRRAIAMKMMLGEEAASPVRLSRFLEEAQITGQLDHPGVVPVHELGLDAGGRVYFTMRLVRGHEFGQVIRQVREGGDWTLTRAVSVLLKICETMAFAHVKGVIHRDLKPANLMVGDFGEAYVMDWGLAKVLSAPDGRKAPAAEEEVARVKTDRGESSRDDPSSVLLTREGTVLGTVLYMPPEQGRGRLDEMGPWSDVYSVGAILYHLLSGVPPYAAEGDLPSGEAALRRLQRGPPRPIASHAPDAPVELCAICERAMARKPRERYAGMMEMAEDLRAYLEGRVVRAYETGAFAELKKWVVRNKGVAATAAAALLAVLALSFWAMLERQQANRRAADVLRLSSIQDLRELKSEANDLWPAVPEMVAAYEDWLARARELVDRLPALRGIRDELRARAARALAPSEATWTWRPDAWWHDLLLKRIPLLERKLEEEQDPARRARLEGFLQEDRESLERAEEATRDAGRYAFERSEDRWWHDQIDRLVRDLESFADPETGPIDGLSAAHGAGVERRLRFAETIEERSVSGAEASRRWREAIEAIRDRERSPAYAGLEIRPQIGLLPIGKDPHSGLYEFIHLQSGEPPVRDESGELAWEEESGVVLVLLPGGDFLMGAQAEDPGAPHHDPEARPNEVLLEVRLDPFFIGKCEVTQAQFERVAGANPSNYTPRYEGVTLLHPVEKVNWAAAESFLRCLGLEFPTEAQWEYAARGGTHTPFWTGADRESAIGAINVADRAAAELGARWTAIAYWPELHDGHGLHAPVNALRANPFGLHGIHGNVREWCRDGWGLFEPGFNDLEEGTGLRLFVTNRYRMNRGGGFMTSSEMARVSMRHYQEADGLDADLGIRAVRRLAR